MTVRGCPTWLLEARWYCPTSARAVDDGEATDVHFA